MHLKTQKGRMLSKASHYCGVSSRLKMTHLSSSLVKFSNWTHWVFIAAPAFLSSYFLLLKQEQAICWLKATREYIWAKDSAGLAPSPMWGQFSTLSNATKSSRTQPTCIDYEKWAASTNRIYWKCYLERKKTLNPQEKQFCFGWEYRRPN